MRLATAFATHQVPTYSEGFAMTMLLPRVPVLTLKSFMFLITFHYIYCIIRLMSTNDRPYTVDTYYGPHGQESPYYELLNVSQVQLKCHKHFIIY